MMGIRSLTLVLPLACSPAGSFVLPVTRLRSVAPLRQDCDVQCSSRGAARSGTDAAAVKGRERFMPMELGLDPLKRRCAGQPVSTHRSRSLPLRSQQVQASAEETTVSGGPTQETLPECISNDAVSYWVHPAKESHIWLVGVVHGTKAGVEQLVEETIRGVRPEVVMVELDAHRICVLPPGEAMETRNGLWWWAPEEEPEESADVEEDDDEDGEYEEDDNEDEDDEEEAVLPMSEIQTAVREAGACGARVLLGDRDYETTGRLLEKAKRADMASAQERKEFNDLTTSFDCEESTRAITRKECAQMKQRAPRVFRVMCTQRRRVMAKNLMKLRGEQTTVAVFGMAHLDGVEKVLKGNGWERRRA
ncbi:unnamed protein product [Ectocarpus fasciculatus]